MVFGGSSLVRKLGRSLCCALVLFLGAAGLAGATPSASEDQLIQRLIARVEAHRGMVFLRNGEEHGPAEAAQHLRDKYDYFKKEIVTAEDFILRCGTRSEMSNAAYKVKTAGASAWRESNDFLREELKTLRQQR